MGSSGSETPRSFLRRWGRARADTEWLSFAKDIAPSVIAGGVTALVTWGFVGGRLEDLAIPLGAGLVAATLFLLVKNSAEFAWNFAVAGYKNEIDDLKALGDPAAVIQKVNGARLLVLTELEAAAGQVSIVRMTRPHPHYSKDFTLPMASWRAHGPTLAESSPALYQSVVPAYSSIQWFNDAMDMRRTRQGENPKTLAVTADERLDDAESKIAAAISALKASPTSAKRVSDTISLEAYSDTFQPTQIPYPNRSSRLSLRVRNTSDQPIKDCRVRLDEVERQQEDGSWQRIEFFTPGFRKWEDGADMANLGPSEPMNCPLVEHDPRYGTHARLVRGPFLNVGVIRLTASIRVADAQPAIWQREIQIGALGPGTEAQALEWRKPEEIEPEPVTSVRP